MNSRTIISRLRRSAVGALALGLAVHANAQTSQSSYPIDLPTALRLANAQNLDVQIARESVRQAEAQRTSAIEQFLPWLSPALGYHRRDGVAQASPSGIIGNAAYQSYQPGASLSAQVAAGDAYFNSLAARRLVTASQEGLEAQQQNAVLLAAQGYFELLKSKALAEVLQGAIAISQNYQTQLHNAVAIGIAFRGDELRVQSQTEHYQMLLRDADAQERLAAVDLVRVLHLDPTVELAPRDSDLVPVVLVDTTASLDSLIARALRARPELRRASAVIDASEASRRGAVYGALIPALGVQGFAGALGGGPDSGRSRVAGMADYTVSLGWRIGPGGLFDQGRVNAASAQLSTAKLNQQKLRESISAEVLQAAARVRAYGSEIGLAGRTLASAQEALRLTEARRQFGVGAVLEDILAQQAVTQARSDYVTVIALFNKAQYGLAAAIGERAR
jgi:outer membrane protein TolC